MRFGGDDGLSFNERFRLLRALRRPPVGVPGVGVVIVVVVILLLCSLVAPISRKLRCFLGIDLMDFFRPDFGDCRTRRSPWPTD